MSTNPRTIAYVSVTRHSLAQGVIAGKVKASSYQWQFEWCFRKDELIVNPSLGRALILEPLSRFLERSDYHLEAGGDYEFSLRAKF
ncbi:MAG: DUF3146 family protein [Synechococcaceae cyanobacterium RL_1_2]|nr:DUF3146 family protein [Synechococcaceae cyanobacterium RL_1_2]